jgi:hypothetical protein
MRLLLVLMLVTGLVPGLGEVAETAVHLAVGGHLAHTAADRGDLGDLGDEHGCGTTEHHCSCCASQVVIAASGAVALPVAPPDAPHPVAGPSLASLHAPAPPSRPPIAS